MGFQTNKFNRIMHFPFSPGATNDDRIAGEGWFDYLRDKELIFLEKLDGENTCFKKDGIYARTHSVPNRNPWANYLWPIHNLIKSDIGELEIFGENMYAIHSIEYNKLTSYFYVFAVREGNLWKSWEETKFIANYFNLSIVPEWNKHGQLFNEDILKNSKKLESAILSAMNKPNLGSLCEGVVTRIAYDFFNSEDSTMSFNMLKYVRKNHVKTDEHWTKNWRKAQIYHE